MFIEKVYIYLVMALILALIFRVWRNERRLNRVEGLMRDLGKHGVDVDNTIKALMETMERLFRGLKEGILKEKEKEDERRKKEETRKSESD